MSSGTSVATTHVDIKGILRGSCLEPPCTCSQYQRPIDGVRCAVCDHAPGRHQEIQDSLKPDKLARKRSVNLSKIDLEGLNLAPPQDSKKRSPRSPTGNEKGASPLKLSPNYLHELHKSALKSYKSSHEIETKKKSTDPHRALSPGRKSRSLNIGFLKKASVSPNPSRKTSSAFLTYKTKVTSYPPNLITVEHFENGDNSLVIPSDKGPIKIMLEINITPENTSTTANDTQNDS